MKVTLRLVSSLAKLLGDQAGQILIYFTILLPVMMGLVGLSLEGGRLLMLHSQLQDLADAAALAGAKELNGAPDAITRATNAAETVLTNDTWWSNVALGGLQVVDPPIYYSALKGQPTSNPAPNDIITTDPAQAEYIKVTTVTRQVTPAFLVAVGAISASQTRATATAGTTYVACNVQPLMLCNPNEPNPFNPTAGDLFGFTQTGNTGGYSPGDFNLLDPAGQTHSGAQQTKRLLAATNPNFCYINNVSPAQGQRTQDVADGVNVRLDMPPGGNSTGVDTTPAPNVIKGQIPNAQCRNFTQVPGAAMPINTSMTTVGSALVGGTMDATGASTYWQYHHGSSVWPVVNGQPITRYQAYQGERAVPPTYPFVNVPPNENPAPQCSSPIGDDTRRIISVAVVDCLSQNVKGNSNQILMARSYAEFFLTRPVTPTGSPNPPNYAGVIWLEFIRLVTPSSTGGKLHQIVQLYRDE